MERMFCIKATKSSNQSNATKIGNRLRHSKASDEMDALNQLLLSLWPVQHATLCNCSKRKINQSSRDKPSEQPSLKFRHSIKQSSVRWSVGVVTFLFRLLARHLIFKFEVRHSRIWLPSYFHSYILPSFTLLFSGQKWAAPYRAGKLKRWTVDFLFLPRSRRGCRECFAESG